MNEQIMERLKIGGKIFILFLIISFVCICLYNFAIEKNNQFFNNFDEKNKLKPNWGKIIGYSILFGLIMMIIFMIVGEVQIRNLKYGRCYPYTIYKIFGGEDVFCDQD